MIEALVLPADESSPESLREGFGESFVLEPATALRVTLLDSFDWRIHEAGARLTLERCGGRDSLHWRPPQHGGPYVLPVSAQPRFVRELPPGFLRAELEPIVELRALLPLAAARVTRRAARIRDDSGNTVVQLLFEDWVPLDASRRSAGPSQRTVVVRQVGTRRRPAQKAIALLRAGRAPDEPAIDPLAAAAAARGRRPGDYSSKPRLALRADQPAEEALRAILGHLAATLRANVAGVINDTDVEFLHDLRVAVRRARSAIGQLKQVLPQPAVETLAAGLGWLGSVSNPCRDLDVALQDMEGFKAALGAEGVPLDEIEARLRRDRGAALSRVRAALRSRRFARLLAHWLELAEEAPGEPLPARAALPIAEIAGARILKAYRRMLKAGAKLADPPAPAALHRLRINAKKLRYLLEFFASLYPEPELSRLVKELKGFQDVLGGFNDMELERARFVAIADELIASGRARPEALFAVGRLVDAAAARQDEYRREFADRFSSFASRDSRALYARLFGGG
jgi:CHAD domain-containing protein